MRILKILGAVIGLIGLAIGALYIALQPPKISVSPQYDGIISGVTIWNPGDAPIENRSIVIANGLIVDIRDVWADDPEPLCADCFVMPGLIDAHVHTPPKLAIGNQQLFSLLYLHYGVTTVRDLGQLDNSVLKLSQNIHGGKLAGPRIYRCGPALDGVPAAFQGALGLQSGAEGTDIVAQLAGEGVDCIKTYDNLPADAFRAASAEAQRHGLPLVGHTPHDVKLSEIRNFEIAHYTGIPYLKNDPLEGFAYLSQDLIDMSEDEVGRMLSVMTQNNLSILPTNANALARLTVSAPDRFPPSEGVKHLPAFWDLLWPGIVSHPETEEQIQTDLLALPAGLNFVGQARKAGIDVLAGTDVVMPYVVPGESLHLQIALLASTFRSDEAALVAATRVNGRHLDDGMVGHLKVGAYADMLIFKEDPRNNLAYLKDWTFLISNGRIYEDSYIDAAIAKYDRHFNGRLYTSVMKFVFSIISGTGGLEGHKNAG